ncbi:MAG: hypothetical protein CL910_01060 [Deltaproteobacteria bacterium]|nr:hypothetical protein [Deltaproteobacteria bacterium]
MEYRVEELARLEGVRVDTIRFYRTRGLLAPPERRGRVALYGEEHREQLAQIRSLREQGFKLVQIARLLAQREDPTRPGGRPAPPASDRLLDALVEEHVGARTFSRQELAAQAGVPETLVTAAQAAGLVEPIQAGGEERFGEADLEMARAGLELLGAGFPVHELLALAVRHAEHVREVSEAAIALFDEHVRKDPGGRERDASRVTDQFRTLLPLLTRLVAQHFQRTLVHRAMERVADRGSESELRDALVATEAALEVNVSWR